MSKGLPVMVAYYWKRANLAHVTTLAGCGGGHYYLHDSEAEAGSYTGYDWHDICYYATAPGVPDDYRGKWYMTVYPAGVLPQN